MTLTETGISKLYEPLPTWAVKPHPVKKNMSSIHPMAIVDRLNDVFGLGNWNYTVEYISCDKELQTVKDYGGAGGTRERTVYVSAVKGRLEIEDMVLEQFGGSTNDDKGDSLKGGATDALTKIASYLGIGATIYKGQGNTAPGGSQDATEGFEEPFISHDRV